MPGDNCSRYIYISISRFSWHIYIYILAHLGHGPGCALTPGPTLTASSPPYWIQCLCSQLTSRIVPPELQTVAHRRL